MMFFDYLILLISYFKNNKLKLLVRYSEINGITINMLSKKFILF